MANKREYYPPQDILKIAASYGIPAKFPEQVLKEADSIPQIVSEKSLENLIQMPQGSAVYIDLSMEGTVPPSGRLDFRSLPTVTIDGEYTRDYDDAVSLTRMESGWQIGVHIADVSEYVTEGSALDKEALRRGTSFYPADRVIPMLPAALSNGICSLNAGTDRLTLSCLMNVDKTGILTGYRIAESVIHVDARLTYGGVVRLLQEGDESEIAGSLSTQGYRGIKTRTHRIAVMLRHLFKITRQLRNRRMQRGALDFDFPESRIELDSSGKPVRISAARANIATQLIEELMILANETVARHCCVSKIPSVYRVHAAPERTKLYELRMLLARYGYRLKPRGGKVAPADIAAVIEQLQGRPEQEAVSRLILRSMQRAVYDASCEGHFGLALQYYCHFTSPIRRYPDLLVHRFLKEWMHGQMTQERRRQLASVLPQMARQSSDREEKAMEAEREAAKLKKAEYMQAHIGEVYSGVISGVTSFGLFVELPDTVEGLIFIGDLPGDYYDFDEYQSILVGELTGRRFALGDPVTVIVKGADPVRRFVDFDLFTGNDDASRKPLQATREHGEEPKGRKAAERDADRQERARRHGGTSRMAKKKARGRMDRTGRALRGRRSRNKRGKRR